MRHNRTHNQMTSLRWLGDVRVLGALEHADDGVGEEGA